MSLEKHEHRWTKLEDREKVTKLNKSTPRSKALKEGKKKLVGKEGYKPSKFIDHYE